MTLYNNSNVCQLRGGAKTEVRPLDRAFLFRSSMIAQSLNGGLGMGMPLNWHRRHAMTMAGQLPDNLDDARLVLQAITELLETFMAKGEQDEAPARPTNVLPFATG